jgi:NitT/TauT family transport system substrate-binding protein
MMRVEKIWPAIALIAAASLVALGMFGILAPDRTILAPRLRLAINPWPAYEVLYLAGVKKFYEAEGLNVELVQFSTLDDARRSFERGQVDAIATTLVDVVQIYHDTGEMPRILLAADYSDGSDVIVSLHKRVRDVKSLKGKTVAVEQMFGRFILDSALQQNGMSMADVRIVETSVMSAPGLLARGSVDAIVTYAPYTVEALKVAGSKVIFTTKDSPEQVFDVVATRVEHLERIPDLQPRLMRVWKRAMEVLESEPEAAHEIMARRERISVPEFKEALAGVRLIPSEQQASMLARSGPVARSIDRLTHFTGWSSARTVAEVSPEGFLSLSTGVGREN